MQQLLDLMLQLRQQCPWNQAQTPMSLTQYAIEEAYEVQQAVQQGEPQQIKEELGDLLFQVVFQCAMHAEKGVFDFADVLEALKQKIIRRHPHVFEHPQHLDQAQVKQAWQAIKQQERLAKGQAASHHLAQIKAGPSVQKAQQLQTVAATLNFDWPDVTGAWSKLDEELLELKQALAEQDQAHIQEELGDSLFALINVGRKLGQDCDQALGTTIEKFMQRFGYIEQALAQQGVAFEQASLAQLDQLWDAAKDALAG